MSRRILCRSQYIGRTQDTATEDGHSGEGDSGVTERKRSQHGILLIITIGMIVGLWALLRAAGETDESIPTSQSDMEELAPPDAWLDAFILVDAMGPQWDPCDLLHSSNDTLRSFNTIPSLYPPL